VRRCTIAAGLAFVAVIGAALLSFGVSYWRAYRLDLASRCEMNRRSIEVTKQAYAILHNLTNGAPIDPDALQAFFEARGGDIHVRCPLGGTYQYGSIGQAPSCTECGPLAPRGTAESP
jgi:hypothetical protein